MVRASAFRRLVLGVSTAFIAAWAAPAFSQAAGSPDASPADTLQSLQERIQADPQMMSAVQSLRDDAQVQAILADPTIAAALSRGDIAALLADPRIKHLAEDPAVQKLTRQVTE